MLRVVGVPGRRTRVPGIVTKVPPSRWPFLRCRTWQNFRAKTPNIYKVMSETSEKRDRAQGPTSSHVVDGRDSEHVILQVSRDADRPTTADQKKGSGVYH
eukprot:2762428-Rhodomonas_salina.1